jgi:archaellum component FlaG (FlaF/FlaG flagellin family)
MEVAMEDIVQIRIVFVVGLLVMSGVLALLAFATVRLGDWLRARAGRTRPSMGARQTVKNIPMRGTR